MGEAVWPQYETSFRAYDLDGDGFITRKDFSELESRLGRPEDFSAHIANLWSYLVAAIDTNKDHRLSPEEWYRAWESLRLTQGGFDSFPDWYKNYCEFIFAALDGDGDGRVVESEYHDFLKAFGREPVSGTFKALDTTGTGSLGREELHHIVYDLTCVRDERNVVFWGQPAS